MKIGVSTKDLFISAYIASKWDIRMSEKDYKELIEEAEKKAEITFK